MHDCCHERSNSVSLASSCHKRGRHALFCDKSLQLKPIRCAECIHTTYPRPAMRPTEGGHLAWVLPRLLLLFVLALLLLATTACARRITIGDDIGEDAEDLRRWGLKSGQEVLDDLNERRRQPPAHTVDIGRLGDEGYMREMTLRNIRGPTLTFVRLVPDASRVQSAVERLARLWTEKLRSGQVDVRFYAASPQQIVAVVDDAETALLLRDFLLAEPLVYEWEVERTQFRRVEDTVPYEELDPVADRMRAAERAAEVRDSTRRWQERRAVGAGDEIADL